MSNKKASIRLTRPLSPVASNPEAVQDLINEYFNYSGSSKMIEDGLWEMFSGSISNPEIPTDSAQNANLAFVYRQLVEFIKSLEPYYVNRNLSLPTN